MRGSGKPPRYKLISHPVVSDDLLALASYGPDVVVAARAALDDLAHGRVTGKALGERRVSDNLTGLARVKFDAPGSGTQRFRLVYADIDATTRGVLAIGVRDEHAIYRMAIQRIAAREESGSRLHNLGRTSTTILPEIVTSGVAFSRQGVKAPR